MTKPSRLLTVILAVLQFSSAPFSTIAQKLTPLPNFQPEWIQDFPPFRIAGNLYYVGTYELASYLITTPAGDILINTGLPGSDTMIRRSTRAKMMIEEKDAPVKADRLLHDHDTVKLGGMEILVLHHPGHTKGACNPATPITPWPFLTGQDTTRRSATSKRHFQNA
jgi:metallo-beta-lactamase class B